MSFFRQMPYVKDAIGKTPRYEIGITTQSYLSKDCRHAYKNMTAVGIEVYRKDTRIGCELTFLDIYDAYAKSLSRK